MPPEETGQTTKKGGGTTKLLILVGALGLTLMLVGGVVFWIQSGTAATAARDFDPDDRTKPGDFWPLPARNVTGLEVGGNLSGKDAAVHFKAIIQFELRHYHDARLRRQAMEEMGSVEPWIADRCRSMISRRTEAQLNNEAEQDRIKEEIIQIINNRLQTAQVRDVLFRELYTQ